MKIFIAVANFNRGEIAKKCIYSLWKSKDKNDELVIFDDATTEYEPYDYFADRCNRCVISPTNMGIHAQRREHIKEFVKSDCDYVYFSDNDCFHHPQWREKILKISKESGLIASLYNSPYHASHPEWLIEEKKDYLVRQYCAGISMLLTREMAQKCYDKLDFMAENEKEYREANQAWCWDFSITNLALQIPTAVSKISYCEHLGAGGIHNQNFEQDHALNPDKFLKNKRIELIKKFNKTMV